MNCAPNRIARTRLYRALTLAVGAGILVAAPLVRADDVILRPRLRGAWWFRTAAAAASS
ncbi:hypothetical protein [Diaphorobacter aerolatus]|uniref:Uncharacterized protein n=1 Tax=Diaphorobacter aerolatus TaxID=1288495 RepID=A0A7H0GGW4_9BURK|nr:hypothetical protein [Diaphorobacter aerolatus]QNP47530.1 hypothetical protein H9K75_14885 [Diaphorobacter aerolatus]